MHLLVTVLVLVLVLVLLLVRVLVLVFVLCASASACANYLDSSLGMTSVRKPVSFFISELSIRTDTSEQPCECA